MLSGCSGYEVSIKSKAFHQPECETDSQITTKGGF